MWTYMSLFCCYKAHYCFIDAILDRIGWLKRQQMRIVYCARCTLNFNLINKMQWTPYNENMDFGIVSLTLYTAIAHNNGQFIIHVRTRMVPYFSEFGISFDVCVQQSKIHLSEINILPIWSRFLQCVSSGCCCWHF